MSTSSTPSNVGSPDKAPKRSLYRNREAFESIDFYSSLQISMYDEELESNQEENFNEEEESAVREDESNIQMDIRSRRERFFQRIQNVRSNYLHSYLRPLVKFTKSTQVKSVIFLTLLGILGSATNLIVDTCIIGMETSHTRFSSLTRFYAINYLLYIIYALVFGLLAAACVSYISSHSAGSGVPEMKSILAGNYMDRYLTFNTLIAKAFGTIAGLGAGLHIGRLGPFVHISSCIGNLLLQLGFFRKLRKQEYERISLLSAACALGVASTFGAPIGGVLFSIEVTSTYYPVQNLWRCLFCTLFGSFFFYVWRKLNIIAEHDISLFSTNFPPFPYQITEILLFIVVGILCGMLGAFFNYLYTKTVQLRQRYQVIEKYRYWAVGCITLLTALVAYPAAPLVRYSPNSAINLLFSNTDLPMKRPILNLSMSFVAKFILSLLALVLPIPCGLFLPVFTIGAVMGRLFAEVLKLTNLIPDLAPAYYAVACAAGLSAGVTRALSTIVVVFELTGQLSLLLPVMITIIVAAGVGNLFNEDIYTRILNIRGLPMPLSEIQKEDNSRLIAKDLMRQADFISADHTLDDIELLLERTKHAFYPIVDNATNKTLIGVTRREDLITVVGRYLDSYTDQPMHGINNSDGDHQAIDVDQSQLLMRNNRQTHTMRFADNQFTNKSEMVQVGSREVPMSANPKMILSSNITGKEYSVQYDPSPLTIPVFTPYPKIHVLFSMLRLGVLWVTMDGKLCGVMTKSDIMTANS